MEGNVAEWVNLVVRWFHVVAGILWIGQTFLFNRLETRLAAAARQGGGRANVWLVHSGGFYVVEKETSPATLPPSLFWFKWESALTWMSGFVLLLVVYYGGGLLVSGPDAPTGRAMAVGLGVLVGGFVVYDALCRSPLGRNAPLFATVGFGLIVGTAFLLTRFLSGRAAYIHVGGMLGTIMAANVWSFILPTQRRMIAAIGRGEKLPPALEAQAMMRTKHNTYLSLPLVFLMVSNHFPTASYGHAYNWAMLGGFVLAGWAAVQVLRKT
jgi:uncharacterized membrane protein